MNCTKARALREKIREPWALPKEPVLAEPNPDWLLNALSQCSGHMLEKLLLVLWRSWHLREDIVHNKGEAKISDSVLFLKNYWQTLNSEATAESDIKGKKLLHVTEMRSSPERIIQPKCHWSRPQGACIKLNIDASFVSVLGSAWAGAVTRDSTGSVVFSVGCHVQECDDAEEAEASALVIGLKCLRNVYKGQVYVESDCVAVVNAMNTKRRNKAK